jgi:hypothetical protein
MSAEARLALPGEKHVPVPSEPQSQGSAVATGRRSKYKQIISTNFIHEDKISQNIRAELEEDF